MLQSVKLEMLESARSESDTVAQMQPPHLSEVINPKERNIWHKLWTDCVFDSELAEKPTEYQVAIFQG